MDVDVTVGTGDDHVRFTLASWQAVIGDEQARRALLDEMVDVLTGFRDADPPLPGGPIRIGRFQPGVRDEGVDWPSTALTMVGRQRLRNFGELIERVVADGVPGDVIEAGVWRGGASMFARAVMASLSVTDRRLILADSFEGLPPPDPAWPADADSDLHTYAELAVSLEEVRANFERFGLLDEQVVFLPGWFKDTMPTVPSTCLSVMRLDGDMYESTMEPLVHLYDRLSVGGWVIIDDYALRACRQAVKDFFQERGETPEIKWADRIGAYLQKTG